MADCRRDNFIARYFFLILFHLFEDFRNVTYYKLRLVGNSFFQMG